MTPLSSGPMRRHWRGGPLGVYLAGIVPDGVGGVMTGVRRNRGEAEGEELHQMGREVRGCGAGEGWCGWTGRMPV